MLSRRAGASELVSCTGSIMEADLQACGRHRAHELPRVLIGVLGLGSRAHVHAPVSPFGLVLRDCGPPLRWRRILRVFSMRWLCAVVKGVPVPSPAPPRCCSHASHSAPCALPARHSDSRKMPMRSCAIPPSPPPVYPCPLMIRVLRRMLNK